MSEVLFLTTEISRIDCRLMDGAGKMQHFCVFDRVDAETVQIVGVAFLITRRLVMAFMRTARDAGFKYIQYERVDKDGQVRRRIKYDVENFTFIEKEFF